MYTVDSFASAAAFNNLEFAEKLLTIIPPVVKREDITSIIIAAFRTENLDFIEKTLNYLFEETKDQYQKYQETIALEKARKKHQARIALEDAYNRCSVSETIEGLISTYLPQDSDDEEKMQDADDCLNYQETHKEAVNADLLALDDLTYAQGDFQTENADNFSPTQIGECEERSDSL